LAEKQETNLESINPSFLFEMCLKFVKRAGNMLRLSSKKLYFISVAQTLWVKGPRCLEWPLPPPTSPT
jgi:hypothetical protein